MVKLKKRRTTGSLRKIKKKSSEENIPKVRIRKRVKAPPPDLRHTPKYPADDIVNLLMRSTDISMYHDILPDKNVCSTMTMIMARKLAHTINELNQTGSFEGRSFGLLLDVYKMTSILYYQHDESIMRDELFDQLCKYLHDNYSKLPDTRVDKGSLRAGTGYQVTVGGWFREQMYAALKIFRENFDDPFGRPRGTKKDVPETRKRLRGGSKSVRKRVRGTGSKPDKGKHASTDAGEKSVQGKPRLRRVRKR